VKISRLGEKPRGKPRPKTLKFCLAYDEGYIMTYMMVVSAPKALEQAKRVEDYLQRRLKIRGLKPREMLISYVGINSLHGPAAPMPKEPPNEVAIRFAFKADTEQEARMYQNEATLTWYAAGVGAAFAAPDVKPVMALWPTLIPREAVPTKLEMREVK
jgi:hypothetical protein